jgi:thioredoxin
MLLMTASFLHAVCAHCGGVNRIPEDRLTASAAAKCGKCGEPLFPGQAEAVSGDVFEKIVARSDVPVLVDFWAPWCGPCRRVSPIVEEIAGERGDALKVVKLNIDENQQTAIKFNVMSIPTLMVFSNGEVKKTVIGAYPKKKLEEELEPALA